MTYVTTMLPKIDRLLFSEVRYVMRHEGFRRPMDMFYKERLDNLLWII